LARVIQAVAGHKFKNVEIFQRKGSQQEQEAANLNGNEE
jgi:hypothetical protein